MSNDIWKIWSVTQTKILIHRKDPLTQIMNQRKRDSMSKKIITMRKLISALATMALMALLASQVLAKEMTVSGRLQRTVEAGGWVIVSVDQKYLLLNAPRFQNEKWFTEGNEVEAVGEIKSG